MSEYWDIYDCNRRLTGKTVKRGDFMSPDEFHIVVDVCIRNSNGEWLISQRTPNKTFPLMWAMTGGSAVSGEDSITAALRETKEELGITLDKSKGRLYRTDIRKNRKLPDFNDIWVFDHNCDICDIVFQEGETCDAKWATSQEIIEMINNNKFIKKLYTMDLFKEYD